MEIYDTGVTCDTCGWERRGRAITIYRWFNKKCPECGAVVITIKDISQFTAWLAVTLFVLYPLDWAIGVFGCHGKYVRMRLSGLSVNIEGVDADARGKSG